jgi:hypothetical protein
MRLNMNQLTLYWIGGCAERDNLAQRIMQEIGCAFFCVWLLSASGCYGGARRINQIHQHGVVVSTM